MSKSNAFETDLLGFVFQALPLSAFDGVLTLWVSLHTSDPGEGGSQLTSEVSYVPYGRVGVVRSGAGWSLSGDTVTPVSAIAFPQVASGSGVVTHMGIGTGQTGAGYLVYSGTVTPNIGLTVGEIPTLTDATSVVED